MFQRIKALVDHWHEMKEVESLTERDLDDLGMTRSQVEAFVRMPHDVPDRVIAMAEIFGLSEAQIKADHDGYVNLLYTCGHCKERGACTLLLERGSLTGPEDARFCLNKHAFESQAVA
jgi:hypothetical protein